MSKSWKLSEIVVGAMIAAVMGVVFVFWSNLYIPLQSLLGPIGVEIMYGMYFVPGILIMYIMRKPGAAVVGSTLAAFISTLAGDPFGFVNVMVAGFIQGLAPELVFFLTGYKRFSAGTLIIAGVVTACAIFVRDYFVFGYAAIPGKVLFGMIIVRMISGALIGGLLSKLVADGLAKTGVLSNYAIARQG